MQSRQLYAIKSPQGTITITIKQKFYFSFFPSTPLLYSIVSSFEVLKIMKRHGFRHQPNFKRSPLTETTALRLDHKNGLDMIHFKRRKRMERLTKHETRLQQGPRQTRITEYCESALHPSRAHEHRMPWTMSVD